MKSGIRTALHPTALRSKHVEIHYSVRLLSLTAPPSR